MATPAEIRSAVDTKLATLWSAVQSREDAFFTANSRYWQGLKTHTVIPADGVETLPDVGTAVPSYQAANTTWPTAIRNATLPMLLEIHQYVTPDGTAGYVAYVRVQIAGNVWERTAQVGPESWRQANWAQIDVGA